MKVTIVPIVIGAHGVVTKGLIKGQEDLEVTGRVGTIQTTALLRSARIIRVNHNNNNNNNNNYYYYYYYYYYSLLQSFSHQC